MQARYANAGLWALYLCVFRRAYELTVLKVELKSIEFTSDHESGGANILKDNTADWTDSGTAYVEPEWVKSPARNNPISHTKNVALTAKVKVKVEPSGQTFELIGDGPEEYVDFDKTGNTSTGGDQEITITANANLPDEVCTLNEDIDWTIKIGTDEFTADSSGTHKIYVTYGTPSGSEVTEKRLSWDCTTCDGESTLTGIGDKIYDALASEPPRFQLQNPNVPSPLWLLMSSTSYQGQCIDLANLMKLQVELLGGSASIGYVYGSTDTACFSTSDSAYESRSCTNTNHPGMEQIVIYSAGGWNNWEAVCKVDDTCYGVKLYKGEPIDILRYWLGDNTTNGNHQAWVYWDNGSEMWIVCTNPGPYPVPKP